MREMNIGQRVLAQNYRDGPRWVSGTIIQRNSPATYMVKLKSGDVWKRHIDQLREKFDSPQECFEIPVPVNHDDGNIISATTVTVKVIVLRKVWIQVPRYQRGRNCLRNHQYPLPPLKLL